MLKIIALFITIIIPFYNHASKYIMGCVVTKKNILIGVFEIPDKINKLQQIYSSETKVKDINDFPAHIASVVTTIETKHKLETKQKLKITRACFAGPGTTDANNQILYLPHAQFKTIDCLSIKQQVSSLSDALIVNDFESLGFGIQEAIEKKQLITLHQGNPQNNGIQAIIGAGNGLGSVLMVFNEKRQTHMPQSICLSFADFCAQTHDEIELLQFLLEKTGSKSWGKVLGSTGGVAALYEFLHRNIDIDQEKLKTYKENYLKCFADSKNKIEPATQAVTLYMHLYARLARNVALTYQPSNGLYITNTIAEKYPELFTAKSFVNEYFNTKNEYLSVRLQNIPVYLVTAASKKLSVSGAALCCLAYTKPQAKSIQLSQQAMGTHLNI